jgi:hypothetical protein
MTHIVLDWVHTLHISIVLLLLSANEIVKFLKSLKTLKKLDQGNVAKTNPSVRSEEPKASRDV